MSHSQEFVQAVRMIELEAAANRLSPGSRILELGAGAGWQALELQRRGHDVVALEYAHPGFGELRKLAVFPIQDYDGVNIPYPDASFDVVFSSNVLEHVEHEQLLQAEIMRVLRPGAHAVHIMPSPSWRAWSWFSHYIFTIMRFASSAIAGTFARRSLSKAANDGLTPGSSDGPSRTKTKSWPSKLAYYLVPERHGESGNSLSEIWHFSRWRWTATFARAGFCVKEICPVGVFYSGYGVLGSRLSLDMRKRLGPVLGRATTLYFVQRKPCQQRRG